MEHSPLASLFIYGDTYRILRNHVDTVGELLKVSRHDVESWVGERVSEIDQALARHGLKLQNKENSMRNLKNSPVQLLKSSTIESLHMSDVELEYPKQSPSSNSPLYFENVKYHENVKDPRGSVMDNNIIYMKSHSTFA